MVVGVDTSTKKLAFCITPLHDESDITMQVVRLSERNNDLACTQSYDGLANLLDFLRGKDVRLYVEFPISWRSGSTTVALSRVHGALTAASGHRDVKVNHVNNMVWKKHVMPGKGKIDKTKIAHALQQTWPAAFDKAQTDGDLIDAACINIYGRHVARKVETMRRRGTVQGKVRR